MRVKLDESMKATMENEEVFQERMRLKEVEVVNEVIESTNDEGKKRINPHNEKDIEST